jgi:membrane complex biogenesis BtpA family protein
MKTNELKAMFGTDKPVMGMVHLPPLPGAPNYGGSMTDVINHALRDADTLVSNGVHALIVENLGDYPYYPITTEPETVAAMCRAALELRKKYPSLALGINVLRNSWKAALAVALLVDAQFIRLNVLTDSMVTDQGIIQGEAHLAMRYRSAIGAGSIKVFADIYAKHGGPLVRRGLQTVVKEMIHRGMADAIIVSGEESSMPADIGEIQTVKQAAGDTPVFLGSGIGVNTVDYVRYADGCVFGFGTKPSGDMNDPVDDATVRKFMEKLKLL